jgi:hypothetical protein
VGRRGRCAMTLEDLGNIGEFVAAIAVVVSLVYVAFQIRQSSHQISQNTNSVLGSVELETTRLHSDWLLSVAQSPELGRIWQLGISEPTKLVGEEKVQFAMLIGSAFYGIEGPFRQYQRGLLSEDSWKPMDELIARYLRSPAVLEWWANQDVPFARSFSEYVDSKLPDPSRSDPSDVSIWSASASKPAKTDV